MWMNFNVFLLVNISILLTFWFVGEYSKKVFLLPFLLATPIAVLLFFLPHTYLTYLIMGFTAFLLYFLYLFLLHFKVLVILETFFISIGFFTILSPMTKMSVLYPNFAQTLFFILISLLATGILYLLYDSKQLFEKNWFSLGIAQSKLPSILIVIAYLFICVLTNIFFETPGLVLFGMQIFITFVTYIQGFALCKFVFSQRAMESSQREMLKWQMESRDYMNVIRSQRHDYNLHIHALSGMIESGKFEEAKTYMKKASSEASDINDIMPIGDAVIGSMLYRMREEARANGTDISFQITYDLMDIVCNGFECNKIIGNLIQNAIDAVQSDVAKEQGIHVSIFRRRGNSVITVENYYEGNKEDILRVFEYGYTTKSYHEGIGLPMVNKIVTSYGGRIYPEFEGNLIRFVVSVPNKLNLEGQEGKGE